MQQTPSPPDSGRPSYPLWAELDVEAGEKFAAVALDWLDGGSRQYLGTLRDVLDRDPSPSWKEPDDPDAAWGEPNTIWGKLTVARTDTGPLRIAHRAATIKGWRWLEGQLQRPPRSAHCKLRVLDDQGQPSVDGINLEVKSEEHSPGWIRLCARFSSRAFTHPVIGREYQCRWLDLVRWCADRTNPSYGQIGVEHALGKTTLEDRLPANFGRNSPGYTVGESRQILRGYAWLTIIADTLADRLGGVEKLAASGVFAHVVSLAGGGVWLQATDDFVDYDLAHAHRLFSVFAPVLRPGVPQEPGPRAVGPYLLAYADAATHCETEGSASAAAAPDS